VRESVRDALADGSRGVTAKVRWLAHAVSNLETSHEEGRPRWIHCTPLLGQSGSVGIWMIVVVDEEKHAQPNRRFRQAPPVANDVRKPQQGGPVYRDLNSRMNDVDLMSDERDDWANTSRVASSSHERNGAGVHRHMHLDAMRSPSSPRRSINEQRGIHSSASSTKDNRYGNGNSVDSFQI
jgi:hypothetical protein